MNICFNYLIVRHLLQMKMSCIDNLHSGVAVIRASKCGPVRHVIEELVVSFFAAL